MSLARLLVLVYQLVLVLKGGDLMSFNRLMMRQNVDLKNIKATMTIAHISELKNGYGFAPSGGALSPNPLPNGVAVMQLAMGYYVNSHSQTKLTRLLNPENLTFTLNGVRYTKATMDSALRRYLQNSVGETVPVIFHFD